MDDIINKKLVEDSIRFSPHKEYIRDKYLNGSKEKNLKLDSLKLNYNFGEKRIDDNKRLKAFIA